MLIYFLVGCVAIIIACEFFLAWCVKSYDGEISWQDDDAKSRNEQNSEIVEADNALKKRVVRFCYLAVIGISGFMLLIWSNH
jgi:hypothetical protein